MPRRMHTWYGIEQRRKGDPEDPDHPWVKQVNVKIAVASLAAVARALGVPDARQIRNYFSQGRDDPEALAAPGVVFVKPLDSQDGWSRRG